MTNPIALNIITFQKYSAGLTPVYCATGPHALALFRRGGELDKKNKQESESETEREKESKKGRGERERRRGKRERKENEDGEEERGREKVRDSGRVCLRER